MGLTNKCGASGFGVGYWRVGGQMVPKNDGTPLVRDFGERSPCMRAIFLWGVEADGGKLQYHPLFTAMELLLRASVEILWTKYSIGFVVRGRGLDVLEALIPGLPR